VHVLITIYYQLGHKKDKNRWYSIIKANEIEIKEGEADGRDF